MSNNLEAELLLNPIVVQKCKSSEIYSQNLYAALCNNSFCKDNTVWNCSWRHSGDIVAYIRQSGNYSDWYCTGVVSSTNGCGFVQESIITEEIMNDLNSIGWYLCVD